MSFSFPTCEKLTIGDSQKLESSPHSRESRAAPVRRHGNSVAREFEGCARRLGLLSEIYSRISLCETNLVVDDATTFFFTIWASHLLCW